MKLINSILAFCLLTSFAFSQHAPYVDFNPSQNSYIDYGQGANLNCINELSNGNKLTITLWVKWTNKNAPGVGNWANLITLADSTGSGDNGVFWVQHNSDNSRFEFALHTNSREYLFSTTNPVNGTWYFLSLVYDGSLPNNNVKLYVNGIQEATLNKTGNIRTFPALSRLNMGRWPNPGNSYRHFNGKMDEISIWNIALSPTQIQNMMISSELVTGESYDTTGLVGYWNFDNNDANDLSSCQNNGVVGGGATLPVTLASLTATDLNGKVNIQWTTLAEINNDYFEIERSQNSLDFEKIGKVDGSGNSSSLHNYNFIDQNPLIGLSYYRIKQVDFDGKTTTFPIISINISKEKDFNLNIYPNPSSGNDVQLTVNIDSEVYDIIVTDITGREIFRSEANNSIVKIPSSGFKKGIYFLKVMSFTKTLSSKFIND